MPSDLKRAERVRFADFEFDCRSGDLRRAGNPVKLPPQPAKILCVVIRRAGEIVTRQELAEQVWGPGTFVDFEQGLNQAIRQVRSVLEDDAEQPRFLETVPKRGYRFIAPLADLNHEADVAPSEVVQSAIPPIRKVSLRLRLALLATAVTAVALLWMFGRDFLRKRFGSNTRRIDCIAVLPLHNLSPDPDQEYFSEGMTDELITELAKVRGLRVISHTSVNRYANTQKSLPEIGRELGADAVIEGTILRSGEHLRITAQLIDSHSDQHLWADSYERDLRDVVTLQREVADQIVSKVGLAVTPGEQFPPTKAQAVNPAAFESYLKGYFYWNKMNCDGFRKSLEYYLTAIAQDPNFAPAYAGAADSYFNIGDEACPTDEDAVSGAFSKARSLALKAIELDPSLSVPHTILGEIAFAHEWDWGEANKEYRQGILNNPNDAGAHASYAIYLVSMGQTDAGLSEAEKARELDPVSEATNLIITYVLYLSRRYDQAIEQANRTVELFNGSPAVTYWLGQLYERKGMPDRAIEFYLKMLSGVPEEIPIRRAAYQKGGLAGYWREDKQIRIRQHANIDAVHQAMYYVLTGAREKAIVQLHVAYDQHCNGLQFLKVEPVYDSLRDDPKFKELLGRLGL